MRRLHFWQFALITLLLLCLAGSANGKFTNKDEIDEALIAIGSGSTEDMKSRLFTHSFTVWNEEFRAQTINALPAALRDKRLTKGKLLDRVEPVLQRVLQLHGRIGKVELFIYLHDVPLARLLRGCVLIISAGLADPLCDDELAGIISHELGHSYFEDEMVAAQCSQDTRAMRLIELKCDGVAILSLKLLGHDPTHFLKGLQRIQIINKRKSLSSSLSQSHPDLVARARFSDRLIKSLS